MRIRNLQKRKVSIGILFVLWLSVVGWSKAEAQAPTGAIAGLFSVSNTTQVYFSQGNLQYIGSAATPYWKFADHQWEYLGDNGQGSSSETVDRDLFGWGTSGYNHGANAYQPWSTSQSNSDYYAYGEYNYNLYDQTGQADWGYNAISNGGNTENSGWRTLTQPEWDYVINTRSTASGIRYAKATVNGVSGTILLPDNWTASVYALNNTNGGNYGSNTITAEDWANTLEANGAVFLPAAGCRGGTSVYGVGSYGYYWSASYRDGFYAYYVGFSGSGLRTNYNSRCGGRSVRLVRVAENYSFGINATPNPAEGGTVSGGGAYAEGATCTLTATPAAGYTFINWTENGEVVSTEAEYSFTVTGARTLVANFAEGIYIGDGGNATSQYLPSYSFYDYSLTQQIYTPEEIGMAGTINSIAFKNTGAEKTRIYNVYMLLTDKDAFESGTDWVVMSENDLVFEGQLTFEVGQWTTIELETPFYYDGISNLIVGVADVTGNYSSSPHMACLVFEAPSQAIRAYRDNSPYDITNPGVNGTVLDVKNQIVLNMSSGSFCEKPSNFVADDIQADQVHLTWEGGSGYYNLMYRKASGGEWNTIIAIIGTELWLTGLDAGTDYKVRIQSVCEDGSISGWKTLNFSTFVPTEVNDEWSDDFESTTCDWKLINGYHTNAWVCGTATNNGGTHALYISNDSGISHAYSINSDAMVYATKFLHFTDGVFEFSYDWIANGEDSYDFLRVALVPASETLTPSTSVPSGFGTASLPTSWIALDGGGKLNLVAEWQNQSVTINVATGYYYLVLAWRNDTRFGNNPPAAVDNVSITRINTTDVYTITVGANPTDGGTVSGAGIYIEGSTCTLTATSNMGYTFINWTENGEEVSTEAEYSFTVTGERNLVANFTADAFIIVNDGSATNGYVPVYGLYTDAYLKSETVYPADELGAMAGSTISGMGFYATQTNVSWSNASFQVFLKEVDETTINAFIGWDDATIVYEGPLSISNGVMDIVFSTPYYYGGGHLLLGVYNTVQGRYQSSTWYGETVDGASVQGKSLSSLDAIYPTQRNFIPKTKFTFVANGSVSIYSITATSIPAEGGFVTGEGSYTEGSIITLTATANTGYTFINWTENGEVVSTEAEYSFTVTGDRTLVANFMLENANGNNLVFNGDFELGNTGFSTDYIYGNTGSYNHYYVGHDVAEMWSWDSPGYAVGDHTTGGGLFMMVDGALQPNSMVWEQTVTVIPNMDYVFSAWFLTDNIGQIRFEINDVQGPDMTTPESRWVWEQQSMTWNSGNNTEATLKIINRYAQSGGYDYCIDDICFEPVNEGIVPGVFSVSDNTQVYFSRGNLQWSATGGGTDATTHAVADGGTAAGTWRFAEHQWDFVGNNSIGTVYANGQKCNNSNASSTYSGWIDFFSWGTSGWSGGVSDYQPYATSWNYGAHYPGGDWSNDLTNEYAYADWGVYNAISNGGNNPNFWRTLAAAEWEYLVNTRPASTLNGVENARYAKATVNNIKGLILFPDNYSHPNALALPTAINVSENAVGWDENNYTTDEWIQMETAGAVFLPASGWSDGTGCYDIGTNGVYQSTTHYSSSAASKFGCSADGVLVYPDNLPGRRSVRLVKNVQLATCSIEATPNPTEGGTVSGAGTYIVGSTCTLTATANTSYTFINWTENDEVVSTEVEYSFTVTSDRTLVANFGQSVSYRTSLSDDFNDGVIDPELWIATGNNVYEEDGLLKMDQNVTDQNVSLLSKPLSPGADNKIIVERKFMVQRSNNYYYGGFAIELNGDTEVHNFPHSGAWESTISNTQLSEHYLTFIYTYDSYWGNYGIYFEAGMGDQAYGIRLCDAIFDTWLTEKTIVDLTVGTVTYYLNDNFVATVEVPELTTLSVNYYTTIFRPYGWWTGHHHYMDYVNINTLTEDLIAYYPFDGDANDYSGNGYHATPCNSYQYENGYEGECIAVEGYGYMSSSGGHVLLPQMNLDSLSGITVSLWVKAMGLTSTDGETYINFGDHSNADGLYIIQDPNTVSFRYHETNSVSVPYLEDYTGNWVMYTMTCGSDGLLKAYVNGVLVGEQIIDYNGQINTSLAALGRHWWYNNGATSTRFIGSFDEVRIYGRALSPQEVLMLYGNHVYEITAAANPTEGGTISGGGSYTEGSTCTLTATANTGYTFINWTENDEEVSTEAEYSFTVTGNRDLVANFMQESPFIPTEDLVAYFPFDGDANDYSGNGNHGTIIGNVVPATDRHGNPNGAYRFPGEAFNYISVPDAEILHLNAFTLSAWVYTDADNYGSGYLINKGRDINNGSYRLNVTGVGAQNQYGGNNDAGIQTSPEVNQWHMITGTVEGNQARFYVDGVLQSEVTLSNPFSYGNSEPLTLGCHYYSGVPSYWAYTLLGVMDEVRIYNRALTSTEVGLLYNSNIHTYYNITAVANPEEGGTVGGEGSYMLGQTCTLTATPNEGYEFMYWTENGAMVSSNTTYSFTVTEDRTLVAYFAENTQTISLSSGWTWISTYIEQEGINGLTMLEEGLNPNGVMIKSQNDGFLSYDADMWIGTLDAIVNEKMYLVNVTAPSEVVMTGPIAHLADHPITLNPNWTWLGYPSPFEMDVNDALANLNATEGDMLKSQSSFSTYSAQSGWFGSLNTLTPGMGFMYHSHNSQAITLTYSVGMSRSLRANVTAENNHWVPDIHAYPNNMSIMAVVELNGEELQEERYELAVFSGDECRGSARLVYVEPMRRYVAFLSVAGDEDAELCLALYDSATGETYFNTSDCLSFETNAVLGSLHSPFVARFGGNTELDELGSEAVILYPNPVSAGHVFQLELPAESEGVRVSIINALGSVVSTTDLYAKPATLRAPDVPGVYTVRVVTGKQGTCCRKLIVK